MTGTLHSMLEAPNAERSVLGAILLDPRHLTVLTVDEHLTVEHFGSAAHRAVFQAALELHAQDRPVDHLTVTARLADTGQLEIAGGARTVEELTSWVPAAGNAREYGRIVRERHQARQLHALTVDLQAQLLAGGHPVGDLLERAGEQVTAITAASSLGDREPWTPEQLADWFFDELGQPAGDVWRTPFPLLDQLLGAGLARGEQILIAGDEGIGKSHLVDGFLETFAAQGARTCLYINEGGKGLRMRRKITRATGIPGRAMKDRNLTANQSRRALDALQDMRDGNGIAIKDCTGWTASEIVRHIKRYRWDAFAVDIAHNIVKTEPGVAGWDQIAHELRLAPVQADGVMLVAVHLRKHGTGLRLGPPSLDDIRDTGMFAKLADQVLIVTRDRDEHGVLTNDGALILAKVRDGEPGVVGVSFTPSRLRFESAVTVIRGDQWVSPDSRIEPVREEVAF